MPPMEKLLPRPNVRASPSPGSPSWRGDDGSGSTQISQGAAAGNANEFALVPLKGSERPGL